MATYQARQIRSSKCEMNNEMMLTVHIFHSSQQYGSYTIKAIGFKSIITFTIVSVQSIYQYNTKINIGLKSFSIINTA